jgi:hypothetical protein
VLNTSANFDACQNYSLLHTLSFKQEPARGVVVSGRGFVTHERLGNNPSSTVALTEETATVYPRNWLLCIRVGTLPEHVTGRQVKNSTSKQLINKIDPVDSGHADLITCRCHQI